MAGGLVVPVGLSQPSGRLSRVSLPLHSSLGPSALCPLPWPLSAEAWPSLAGLLLQVAKSAGFCSNAGECVSGLPVPSARHGCTGARTDGQDGCWLRM